MMRSRYVHRVYANLRMDTLTKMSLFFGSLGNYFNHTLVYMSAVTFFHLFFFLIVSGLMVQARAHRRSAPRRIITRRHIPYPAKPRRIQGHPCYLSVTYPLHIRYISVTYLLHRVACRASSKTTPTRSPRSPSP